MKHICFVTTGDLKKLATAKRAIGLANPLSDLGWKVSIIMEDTEENRHRASLECDERTSVFFCSYKNASDERTQKSKIVKQIKPNVVYLCAFVVRNIIKVPKGCIKLAEHSELQSGFKRKKRWQRLCYRLEELYSIMYSDGLLNASKYLMEFYAKSARRVHKKCPMLYFPYAYNPKTCYYDTTANRLIQKKENEKFFIFLGALGTLYGAWTMIHSFERLKNINQNLKLILLGKGPEYERVISYIKNKNLNDTIYSMGFVDEEEISGYFSLADAFISPMNDSIQDWARCPSKLYMYLPYQKPIITCKIGEPYNTLGEKGCYYITNDERSMCDTILDIVRNDKWTLDIDSSLHNWKHRADELTDWIIKTYKIG